MTGNDGFSDCFKYVTISGNKCIEWNFPDMSADHDSKEKARRRRIKDYVGMEHLDMPMLDSRNTRSGPSYCDVIVMTEHMELWKTLMTDYYGHGGCTMELRELGTRGYQLSWTSDGSPVISVSFYPGKGKFMVQPGSRDPIRVADWIKQYTNWKTMIPADHEDDSITAIKEVVQPTLQPTAPPMDEHVDEAVPDSDPLTISNASDGDLAGRDSSSSCGLCMGQSRQRDTLTCSNTSDSINQLVDTVTTLPDLVRTLVTKNDQLQSTVGLLTQSWKSFHHNVPQKSSDRHLLIGSSMIRDIDQGKLKDTDSICRDGGTIRTVKDRIATIDKQYEHITIVVGGNDRDSKPPITPEKSVQSYSDLIDTAKAKAGTVSVSSICPRPNSKSAQESIESMNARLQVMCDEKENVSFIISTPSFKLADGSLNDGYYITDGVHLTRPATNKLACCLQLRIKDQAEGACRDAVSQRLSGKRLSRDIDTEWQQTTLYHTDDRSPRQQYSVPRHNEDDRSTHTPYRGHGTSRDTYRCYYCAEEGHDRSTCRHGKPVECHTCRRTGHKAKFCGATWK